MIIINKHNGIWVYNDSINILIISDTKYTYYIEGYIDIHEIINIYENLQIA